MSVAALLTLFLLAFIRRGIRARRWCCAGDAHGHERARGNIIAAIEIHSLLLTARNQAFAADLHTGRRNNQQPAARINRGNLHRRRVSGISQFVGVPHRTIPRPKRKRDRIAIFLLVNRKLHHRHSRRPCGGYLLQLAVFRQCKIKTAFGLVVSRRRLRLVLDLIFFADGHRRAVWLEDHHVGRHVDRLRVLGRFINIHLRRARARRQRVVESHAVIHRPDQHRLRAKPRMVKRELSLRAALGMRDFLHSSLKLDKDKLNSRRRFAGCAIHHRAVNCSSLSNCRQRSQSEPGHERQTPAARTLHCAPPSAGRVPRGRRTCASVT